MCCFSGSVDRVADTRIFARSVGGADGSGRDQVLAYEMTVATHAPLAMILPLPVAAGAGEDAVQFVDLSGCPALFTALDAAFPAPQSRSWSKSAPPPAPLKVVQVGAFVASYVPDVDAFDRLDPRFRLPPSTWQSIPAVRGFGFAVFALAEPGEQRVHPMALTFPRADPRKLFFPTLHIHDGAVHRRATFDHALYLQRADGERLDLGGFAESELPVDEGLVRRAAGVLAPGLHVYRRRLHGERVNADTWV